MGSKSKVYFHFDNVSMAFRDRTKLKDSIELIFKHENKPLGRLDYIFCSDRKLLAINRQFLKHDYYTDIISFDVSENNSLIIGEIYISVDRIRDNSREFGNSMSSELRRVLFHGALHLCGYKDKSKSDRKEMRGKEDYFLTRYLE